MVGGVGRAGGPPAHVMQRKAAEEPVAAKAATVDGDESVKKGKSGSDTPWMHALNQGNGNKTGIHRRFAEEIAAAQTAAGVGDDPVGDGTAPVDGETPVPAPVDGETPVEGEVPVPVEGETPIEVGTEPAAEPIVIDGSSLVLDTPVVEAEPDLTELLPPAEPETTEPVIPAPVDGKATIIEELLDATAPDEPAA